MQHKYRFILQKYKTLRHAVIEFLAKLLIIDSVVGDLKKLLGNNVRKKSFLRAEPHLVAFEQLA